MKWWVLAMALVLGGCATKRQPAPPAPKLMGPSYVDLQPGMRVRVITPLLKSGGFVLKPVEQSEEGRTITLKAGDEFQGYETAYYTLGPTSRVVLTAVSMNREGEVSRTQKSIAPRMRVPRRMRHVRLLYTLKVSDADHNMAVLGARDMARMAALTQAVQAQPATACKSNRNEYCEWIPAGVAVRVEQAEETQR